MSLYNAFWKSFSPNTAPVHRRTPEEKGNIPGNGQGSLHICVGTLHAKDMFREKSVVVFFFMYFRRRPPVGHRRAFGAPENPGNLKVVMRGVDELLGVAGYLVLEEDYIPHICL